MKTVWGGPMVRAGPPGPALSISRGARRGRRPRTRGSALPCPLIVLLLDQFCRSGDLLCRAADDDGVRWGVDAPGRALGFRFDLMQRLSQTLRSCVVRPIKHSNEFVAARQELILVDAGVRTLGSIQILKEPFGQSDLLVRATHRNCPRGAVRECVTQLGDGTDHRHRHLKILVCFRFWQVEYASQ